MTTDEDARRRGIETFRQLVPGLLAEGATSVRDGSFGDELGDLAMSYVFGSLWARSGLDRRSRSLITLGALIALRASEELEFHFPIAVGNGLSIAELEEVIYHLTAYAGYPAATTARNVARAVLGSDPPSPAADGDGK